MKKERKDKDFVKAPWFEGGRTAMDAYVKKELRYPKEALESKTEGRVSIRYTVDYKGKVIEANVISGIGHGCDEEALRIVRSFKFKVPEDGKIKSKYSRTVHIHFRLPGSPPQPAPTRKIESINPGLQIQYQVTTTTPAIKKPTTPKSTGYQITIQIPNKSE
jgi:protein TonB